MCVESGVTQVSCFTPCCRLVQVSREGPDSRFGSTGYLPWCFQMGQEQAILDSLDNLPPEATPIGHTDHWSQVVNQSHVSADPSPKSTGGSRVSCFFNADTSDTALSQRSTEPTRT